MEAPVARATAISETRRQRDIWVSYGNAFRGIPHLELDPFAEHGLPTDHTPRLSTDASLTAFAQLACLRLGTTRAMISLIDGERQHILAEATPDILLRSGSYDSHASSSLWLGNVSIPRTAGICEQVLSLIPSMPLAPEESVIIIDDLSQNDAYANRSYVKGKPHLRFYAGVALLSPKGAVVGALSVFNDKPRDGLQKQEVLHLRDLSATVVEYLESYSIKDQYRRGEQLTRALLSFNDGASALRPFEKESMLPAPTPLEASGIPAMSSNTPSRSQHERVNTLQESILPAHSRSMFTRAASVICASSDLDGVLILDASVAGVSNKRRGNASNRVSEDELATSDGDTGSRSSSHDEDNDTIFSGQNARKHSSSSSGKRCHVLACATPENPNCDQDSPENHRSFAEADLIRLLHAYPKGHIFDVTADGEVVSSNEESDRSGVDAVASGTVPKRQVVTGGQKRIFQAIRSLVPEARSTAFVPLWDYERSRWFAGCLCWSKRPDRQLSARLDLAYLKVFGHSIMTELSRLDALVSDQAKTSFVASISHELRSPLHGILGTLEFIRDTPLDSFQVSMLNSLDACGNTLLDTINHVLDYAKINGAQQQKKVSSRRLMGSKGVRLSSKPLRKGRLDTAPPKHAAFDLALVTEEVVEAVFSALSYLAGTNDATEETSESGRTPSMTSSVDSSQDGIRSCRDRFVVLDIANGQDWSHHLPVGSWRRIVMNLFGNALKYTKSGHVHVSLRSTPSAQGPDKGQTVIFTVVDSGRGMSPQFLANEAFRPFSQENPLAPGTGLGLSIVREIIETIGGKIHVNSDLGSGTEVQVKLGLPPLDRVRPQPQRTRFLEMVDRLRGRRVCILHRTRPPNVSNVEAEVPSITPNRKGLERFITAMTGALRDHLKMTVVHTEEWEGNDADLVICPEPSFDYLAAIRRRRVIDNVSPVTVFVAMDPLEAATLRTDARVVNRESVVEIMTQPCGPYKLATVLNHCLNRFESPEENIWSPIATSKSPRPIHRESSILQRPIPTRTAPANAHTVQLDLLDLVGPSHMANHGATAPFTSDTCSPPSATPEIIHPRVFGSSETMNLDLLHATPELLVVNPMDTLYDTDSTADPSCSPAQLSDSPVNNSPLISQAPNGNSFPSRVLITDDNAINRKLLITFAQKYSIPYQEAENGLQALHTYQGAVGNRFDVILMDISMPVMDGMSATRAIREFEREQSLPRAYVIALTGLASATARLEAWSSGIDHYVTKPVNFKALQRVFNKLKMNGAREI